jgi:hypothetical protein
MTLQHLGGNIAVGKQTVTSGYIMDTLGNVRVDGTFLTTGLINGGVFAIGVPELYVSFYDGTQTYPTVIHSSSSGCYGSVTTMKIQRTGTGNYLVYLTTSGGSSVNIDTALGTIYPYCQVSANRSNDECRTIFYPFLFGANYSWFDLQTYNGAGSSADFLTISFHIRGVAV